MSHNIDYIQKAKAHPIVVPKLRSSKGKGSKPHPHTGPTHSIESIPVLAASIPIQIRLAIEVNVAKTSMQAHGLKHTIQNHVTRQDTENWADHINPNNRGYFQAIGYDLFCDLLRSCMEETPMHPMSRKFSLV